MRYLNVLFDLDGTLSDPYVGITNSIKYALSKFNITEENADSADRLKLFIGPPLEKSFMEYYGFSASDTKKAVQYYREYFSEKGIYGNKLYRGINVVLRTLAGKNINCILATSKLEKYAAQTLKYLRIDNYFTRIAGSNLDGTLSEKTDIIKHIIGKYKLEKERTVMVGDRKYDITGARENGIDSIGVLYGYGTKKEIEETKPTYICAEPDKLLEIILPAA
jgi:phosphoglycolate phosphatase